MLSLLIQGREEEENAAFAAQLAEEIRTRFAKEAPVLIGPTAHSLSKLQDVYRQTMYIKHPDRAVLLRIQDLAAETAGKRVQTDLY